MVASSREAKPYNRQELVARLTNFREVDSSRLTIHPTPEGCNHLAVVLATPSDLQSMEKALLVLHTKMLEAKSCAALLAISDDKANPNELGRTMASLAAGNTKNKTLTKIFELFNVHRGLYDQKTVEDFVNHTNPNQQGKYCGSTPLHFAAEAGRADNIKLLKIHGAKLFVPLPKERGDVAEWTELDIAVNGYLNSEAKYKRLYEEVIVALFVGSAEHTAECKKQAEATLARMTAHRLVEGTIAAIKKLFVDSFINAAIVAQSNPVVMSRISPASSASVKKKRKSSPEVDAAVDPDDHSDHRVKRSKKARVKNKKTAAKKNFSSTWESAGSRERFASILEHCEALKNLLFEMPDELVSLRKGLRGEIKAISDIASQSLYLGSSSAHSRNTSASASTSTSSALQFLSAAADPPPPPYEPRSVHEASVQAQSSLSLSGSSSLPQPPHSDQLSSTSPLALMLPPPAFTAHSTHSHSGSSSRFDFGSSPAGSSSAGYSAHASHSHSHLAAPSSSPSSGGMSSMNLFPRANPVSAYQPLSAAVVRSPAEESNQVLGDYDDDEVMIVDRSRSAANALR